MALAARIGDLTDHPGQLGGPGVANVLIEGMPAAVAGGGTQHVCAFPPPGGPHPTNVVARGSATVFIGGWPAARLGDTCACGATIASGAARTLVGG
jgi:uncharacterized Zn-binding protein involved in type VI secretion